MIRIVSIALIALAIISPAFAATVTGQASATVVNDLLNVHCAPLNFGWIEAGKVNGAVTVFVQKEKRSAASVKLMDASFSRGECEVRGAAGRDFSIDMPETLLFTVEPDGELLPDKITELEVDGMQVYSMNRRNVGKKGRLNASGVDTIFIGGTLWVPKNAHPGVYQGIVPITVSY